MSQLGPERLSLCHGTLISVPPPEFIDAADAAGFRFVSLRVLPAKSRTPGPAMGDFPVVTDTTLRRETRKRLDATGIKLLESEVAVFAPGVSADEFEPYVAASAELGARGVIPIFFGHSSLSEVVDQFGAFAALAARYGQNALIEFIALSAIRNAGEAVEVIAKSGAANGRIIFDTLHWTRSGGTVADIKAVDPALIHGAQINDGKRDFPNEGPNWWEEMAGKRSFLGEGDFQVMDMLGALPSTVPVGIEVISREFLDRGLTPVEMARYAMKNLRDYMSVAA